MLFNSIEFAIFFPIVFLLYWYVFNKSSRLQNLCLIAVSYLFYGWWNWRMIFILLFVTLTTWVAGWGMAYYRAHKPNEEERGWYRNRVFLLHLAAIVINIGILVVFKYYDFFVDSLASAFTLFGQNLSITTLGLVLPLGISFYTFQSLTYSIDIYMKKMEPTRNLMDYLAFMSFFPPLLSGPIGKASQLIPQFHAHRIFDSSFVTKGAQQILWGLFIKMCVADRLGIYVDTVYANLDAHNGPTILLAAVLYSFQIYCDFSGYSLMAIGCARMMGIKLMDNFCRPYFAVSVQDFWRRWHISLSTWFRDYIYFPLGGSRTSQWRHYFNIFITFLVSGLWHGAAWMFLLWGAVHGFYLICRDLKNTYLPKINVGKPLQTIVNVVVTFLLVTFSLLIFRMEYISVTISAMKKIFTDFGTPFLDFTTLGYGFFVLFILIISEWVEEYLPSKFKLFGNRHRPVRWAAYLSLTFIVALTGVFGGGQFIYFQF